MARVGLRRPHRWRKASAGVAALEFALLAPIWVTLLVGGLDFGQAFHLKIKLAAALNVAAEYAFLNAQTLTAGTVAAFLANVATVAQTTANLATPPTVTVLFNNVASAANGANYYCVSGTSPAVYTSTGTASAACGGAVTSGKFVTITIVGSVPAVILGNPNLGSIIRVSDSSIVRVQ